MTTRILVAGATGSVGSAVLPLLACRGHAVRALTRSKERAAALDGTGADAVVADATDASSLRGVFDGVDVVVSSLGASVALGLGERRPYADVDTVANTNLLEAAKASGVCRFVYVGVHSDAAYAGTRYVRAHEAFIERLRASGLEYGVVRPTGIFSAFADLVGMAARGAVPVVGDGTARTNPVDARDVARACVDALSGPSSDVSVGGPQVLTRDGIARAAFDAVGKAPRIRRVPPWVFRGTALLLRPFHPRLSELFQFAARVAVTDAVGPCTGTHTLGDYFREKARALPAATPLR